MSPRADSAYQCAECGKRFRVRCRLTAHERVHSGERPFHCEACGETFGRIDNLRRHEDVVSSLLTNLYIYSFIQAMGLTDRSLVQSTAYKDK